MIQRFLLSAATVFLLTISVAPVAQAAPLQQVTATPFQTMAGCPAVLLTLPSWYRGLEGAGACNPKITKLTDLWIIVLNIVEMLIHLTTYAAAVYTMLGGFQYLTANGEPNKISGAKETITHALTGLIISVVAIAAINFIVNAAF